MDRFEKKLVKYFIFIVLIMVIARAIFVNNTLAWLSSGTTPIVIVLVTIYLLEPLVNFYQIRLNNRHIKKPKKTSPKSQRTLAVVLSFLTILLIIIGFISIILPSIINSVESIMNQLPNSTDEITEIILALPFINLFVDKEIIYNSFNNFSDIFVSFSENIIDYSTSIIISFKDAIVAIGVFILSLLMAFYALRDYESIGQNIELQLRSIFGDKLINPIIRVFHMTDIAMKKFLIGKLYTCIFLGLLVLVFGLIFNLISPKDIPYLPLIAFIIGLTNIIPYVGPFIGTIPSLVFALINGFIPAVALLIIVVVAQQIDNILISPKIIGDSVGLKPFWVLFSVTVGGRLFGIIGMLLTVPITSVILILLDEHSKRYLQTKEKNIND